MKSKLFCSALFFAAFTLVASPARAQQHRPHSATRAAANSSSVYPMHEGFVDAHGVMIYYMMVGRGAPLFVVHGGPGASHDYFLPYLLPLARHNQLVFIDERGSGRSQQLSDPSGYTVENMVEDDEGVRYGITHGNITRHIYVYGGVHEQASKHKNQKNLLPKNLSS